MRVSVRLLKILEKWERTERRRAMILPVINPAAMSNREFAVLIRSSPLEIPLKKAEKISNSVGRRMGETPENLAIASHTRSSRIIHKIFLELVFTILCPILLHSHLQEVDSGIRFFS